MEGKKAKGTLSLRLSESSLGQINDLKSLFGTSAGKVVERAVAYLHENRITIADEDHKQRIMSSK